MTRGRHHLRYRDLAAEALAGLAQRPSRSALTSLGAALGVGAFVAVLGFTATAAAQITAAFNVLTATTVTVDDRGAGSGNAPGGTDFPVGADQRITALNGAVAAGVWWLVSFPATPVISAAPGTAPGSQDDVGGTTVVYAASAGLFAAMQARLGTGVFYNTFHDRRGEPVCVLGPGAASALGITRLDDQPAIFINGLPLTVVGIMSDTAQLSAMLNGVLIPRGTAERYFGAPPSNAPAEMLIRTKLGAAQLIARQAPYALDPRDPASLVATAPPNPQTLRHQVSGELGELFLGLAGVSLLIGAGGIANTVFVSVLERTAEIGLRRALGARRRDIAAQFLAESTALGLLGGLAGTAAAVAAVVGAAVIRHWTAVLDPAAVLPAPLAGAAAGLLAGLYPAMRAAMTEPVQALRR